MSKKGKKYVDAAKRFDRTRTYVPGEALDLVRSLAPGSFDETVEMAVRLGIDPRKADQVVRGTVALPSGTGKPVRVAVFATGAAAEEARAAGADVVGADDLVARVDGGFMDFDVAIATPELMGQVGR
jgi:large subunit ribosomal protein L1